MPPRTVLLTARCDERPGKDRVLLPRGTDVAARRVLVTGPAGRRVLKAGVRADSGPGACVAPEVLAALGREDAEATVEALTFLAALRRDPGLRLSLAVSVLALLSSLATAYVGWVKNSADDALDVVAPVVALLAFAAAATKFWREYAEL